MFLLISVRHVGAPGEQQHDVSIQISISLGKTFLRILSLELNGCPVAPFVHAYFRSRARDFFVQHHFVQKRNEIKLLMFFIYRFSHG